MIRRGTVPDVLLERCFQSEPASLNHVHKYLFDNIKLDFRVAATDEALIKINSKFITHSAYHVWNYCTVLYLCCLARSSFFGSSVSIRRWTYVCYCRTAMLRNYFRLIQEFIRRRMKRNNRWFLNNNTVIAIVCVKPPTSTCVSFSTSNRASSNSSNTGGVKSSNKFAKLPTLYIAHYIARSGLHHTSIWSDRK